MVPDAPGQTGISRHPGRPPSQASARMRADVRLGHCCTLDRPPTPPTRASTSHRSPSVRMYTSRRDRGPRSPFHQCRSTLTGPPYSTGRTDGHPRIPEPVVAGHRVGSGAGRAADHVRRRTVGGGTGAGWSRPPVRGKVAAMGAGPRPGARQAATVGWRPSPVRRTRVGGVPPVAGHRGEPTEESMPPHGANASDNGSDMQRVRLRGTLRSDGAPTDRRLLSAMVTVRSDALWRAATHAVQHRSYRPYSLADRATVS